MDGVAFGAWLREGSELYRVVSRSLDIFDRNMQELSAVLRVPETNIALVRHLNDDGSALAHDYWAMVHQRLHNGLASAVSLIDHTRSLVKFYSSSAPAYVEEWERRIGPVRDAPLSGFLRRFRNYLLHVGQAPLAFTIRLTDVSTVIQVKRDELLEWKDWTKPALTFLEEQPEHMPLADLVREYTTNILSAYQWLLQAFVDLRTDPVVLATLPRYGGPLDEVRAVP